MGVITRCFPPQVRTHRQAQPAQPRKTTQLTDKPP